jgi:hypothetical protein
MIVRSKNHSHALIYARQQIRIFPCNERKQPLVKDWLNAASADENQINKWWSSNPKALIAIAMKHIDCFTVDCDRHSADENGVALFNQMIADNSPLPEHPTINTPNNGQHHIFRQPQEIKIGNKDVATGLETRGYKSDNDGGYIIAPGSRLPDGREWKLAAGSPSFVKSLKADTIPQAAPWLIDKLRGESKPEWKPNGGGGDHSTGGKREAAYAEAALRRCVSELASQEKPGRNNLLNNVALKMATMVARGWIGRATVADALYGACVANGLVEEDGADSVQKTLASGFKAGLAKPHADLENRPRYTGHYSEKAKSAADDASGGVSVDDFYAYMVSHSYIYTPSREMWPASSVNARVTFASESQEKVSKWLDRHRPVEQMTWAPGLPMLIRDQLISEGGWIVRKNVSCFNLYRPPTIELGNAMEADRWRDHVRKVFGDAATHIEKWLAHRVQRPQEKINHALVLGGNQGVGKDTLLGPVKQAVGPWNFSEVRPQHLLGRFNGFLKSVLLRVNEARDLGDINRFQFYDHMKAYTATPPDVLRVDEKNLREYSVFNCVGVIITTNHKADGIYLPSDDRRHFVAWSNLSKEDFAADYWKNLWGWYRDGGDRHVAAYLSELDLASFDPKAPPPKTAAFWDIVDASRAPEDAELADILDQLGNPDATTLIRITNHAVGDFQTWIKDRKNRRVIPHRMEKCGYVPVRNDGAKDGFWKINDRRQVVYAKSTLSLADQIKAASKLTGASDDDPDQSL